MATGSKTTIKQVLAHGKKEPLFTVPFGFEIYSYLPIKGLDPSITCDVLLDALANNNGSAILDTEVSEILIDSRKAKETKHAMRIASICTAVVIFISLAVGAINMVQVFRLNTHFDIYNLMISLIGPLGIAWKYFGVLGNNGSVAKTAGHIIKDEMLGIQEALRNTAGGSDYSRRRRNSGYNDLNAPDDYGSGRYNQYNNDDEDDDDSYYPSSSRNRNTGRSRGNSENDLLS